MSRLFYFYLECHGASATETDKGGHVLPTSDVSCPTNDSLSPGNKVRSHPHFDLQTYSVLLG